MWFERSRPRYRESYCMSWGFQDFIFILRENSSLTSLFVFARDGNENLGRVVSHPFSILDATVVERMTDSWACSLTPSPFSYSVNNLTIHQMRWKFEPSFITQIFPCSSLLTALPVTTTHFSCITHLCLSFQPLFCSILSRHLLRFKPPYRSHLNKTHL